MAKKHRYVPTVELPPLRRGVLDQPSRPGVDATWPSANDNVRKVVQAQTPPPARAADQRPNGRMLDIRPATTTAALASAHGFGFAEPWASRVGPT